MVLTQSKPTILVKETAKILFLLSEVTSQAVIYLNLQRIKPEIDL
jgi:hypothetical protein